MSLLQVQGVSKHFGSLIALSNISMTVEPGELRAIIGPNGAGKTTFFNLITGFFRPTAGRIVFEGQDVTDLLPARRVWCGMARTFQVTEVFPELTVRENLRIAVEVASGFRRAFACELGCRKWTTTRSARACTNSSTWAVSPPKPIARSANYRMAINAPPRS